MEEPDLGVATMKVFAVQIGKAQTRIAELTPEKETLSAKVESAREKSHSAVRLNRIFVSRNDRGKLDR
jgi:hypothetical protein